MRMIKFKQSTSTLCLTMGISMSLGLLVATQAAPLAHAQSVVCKSGNGSTVPDAACSKFVGAKPGPTCGPVGPCYYGSSSSSGGDSDSDSESGVDVNGDGVGDYATEYDAAQDGHDYSDMKGVDNHDGGPKEPSGSSGSSSSGSSSSSSSGGSSRVICTHFYRQGRLSRELWRADLEFTFNNLSWTTVRGYQFWGIPAVYLMRKHPWTEAIFWPLAIHRAEEISYQLGQRDKPNYIGKLIRWTMEPLCFLIGIFVPEQNWKKVHADMDKSLA